MADVKKVDKTAESGGIRNVGDDSDPASEQFITPNTAIQQASATVPGSEAAAKKAKPSDATVVALEANAPTGKTFAQVRAEREAAAKAGHPIEPDPPYGNPNNRTGVAAKPSKKAEKEMETGKKAQGSAGGFTEQPVSNADVAGRLSEESDRNKEADAQIERLSDQIEKEREKNEKERIERVKAAASDK